MRSALALAAVAALSACTPQLTPPNGGGIDLTQFFTFEMGDVETWEFINSDASLTYQIVAELSDAVEDTPEGQVFAVVWSRVCLSNLDPTCVSEALYTVKWRVDPGDAAYITAVVPAGSMPLPFSPPLKVVSSEMVPGDTITTVTSGYTFTSTYEGFATCPTFMTTSWEDQCIQYTVTDGDQDLETNAGITGTFWVIPAFDFVGFQGETDNQVWEISYYDCEGEC